jgi:nucleoside-diphosphate-sugar epimerase
MQYDHHVILGAGGAITQALVPELLRNRQTVTLVSRSGTSLPGTRGVSADVSDYQELSAVIPQRSAVYLLLGLPYHTETWQTQWPQIMDTVIRVCTETESLLVFFDNVYMYGPVEGAMTEDTPVRPTSKKGQVRADIAGKLLDAVNSGVLNGIIARSADFYGPGAERNGLPNLLIVDKLLNRSKAQWLANADTLHSLTYTSDCGRALPLLVADEGAYNQVWHLPTARPPITMRSFTELVAGQLGVKPRLSVLAPWMVKAGGLFDSTIRELPEMLYQNDRDYVFDSSKFESYFAFSPTSYEQGVEETVVYYRNLPKE